MKHIFIVNPVSGAGYADKISRNIETVCIKEKIDFEIRYTNKPKEATVIARSYKKEECIIYSVGGDGTLLEVLNGIVGTKNLLGVIPAGSGNDFYKNLKDNDELEVPIDIGKINDKYFLNVAAIGIDAEIADNAKIMKKRKIPPSQIYNASILYTFFKYKFKKLSLTVDKEEKEGKYTIIAICNGKYYGGGYKIGPNAKIDDGLFDIYLADAMPKIKILGLIPKLKKGMHESSKYITKIESNNIKIKSKSSIVCTIDGEILFDTSFDIRIIKNGVTIYNNKKLVNKILGRK
jgi:lipid kinase, YegS/Rv2252/BmrU family